MASDRSDLQETTSSSAVDDSLNISFEDINYSVRNGILAGGRKTILNSVSGTFNAGELTVIVGQSGAGKSSLMDILAGYTKPSNGSLLVNGEARNEAKFKRRSCYILQDDRVQNALTISESLTVAAELKLGNHVSVLQKKRRIKEIITSLGLGLVRRTRAGNLSGGQRKRLAIGLELVSDPDVMFLDEPTSGLDSSISKQLIFLLHQLARQGRTVVVTLHQPSATLLQMVDRLYAIVGGQCAFTGSVDALAPYLRQMDLICPNYHNCVDFLMEICSENANELVLHSENGKSEHWFHHMSQDNDDKFLEKNNLRTRDVHLTTLPPSKQHSKNKILLKLKSTYSTSAWKQFITLTRRSLVSLWREPFFSFSVLGIHIFMGLFIGTLFYDIGSDAQYIRHSYNMLFFSLMFLMFTAFSSVTINFPDQIPLVRREHFNRWYTAGAYYISSFVSTLPLQTACTLSYACLVYWLSGMPQEAIRFGIFCWTLLIVSYVSLCVGLLNGAIFNVKHGVIFGPFFIMPFTIFSGFFLRYTDAPAVFRWMFHVSFLKHGLVGLVFSIFGMDRGKLPCDADYCHFRWPHKFVDEVQMTHESYLIANVAMLAIGVSVTVCSFCILKIRLKSKW